MIDMRKQQVKVAAKIIAEQILDKQAEIKESTLTQELHRDNIGKALGYVEIFKVLSNGRCDILAIDYAISHKPKINFGEQIMATTSLIAIMIIENKISAKIGAEAILELSRKKENS